MRVLSVLCAVLFLSSCGGPAEAPKDAAPAAPALVAFVPQPGGTLADLMRGIPFPHSNTIFDAQTNDPGAPKPAEKSGPDAKATDKFGGLYGGWQAIEVSGVALQETANLLMIPGRMCENGRPAPLDREDWPKFVQGLREAGVATYKAAKARSQDAVIEVSGQVADACAACHEIYRDKTDNKDRCIP